MASVNRILYVESVLFMSRRVTDSGFQITKSMETLHYFIDC
jgi:hypothetical protein